MLSQQPPPLARGKSRKAAQVCSLYWLPFEMWQWIAKFLKSQDLARLALVDSALRDIVQDLLFRQNKIVKTELADDYSNYYSLDVLNSCSVASIKLKYPANLYSFFEYECQKDTLALETISTLEPMPQHRKALVFQSVGKLINNIIMMSNYRISYARDGFCHKIVVVAHQVGHQKRILSGKKARMLVRTELVPIVCNVFYLAARLLGLCFLLLPPLGNDEKMQEINRLGIKLQQELWCSCLAGEEAYIYNLPGGLMEIMLYVTNFSIKEKENGNRVLYLNLVLILTVMITNGEVKRIPNDEIAVGSVTKLYPDLDKKYLTWLKRDAKLKTADIARKLTREILRELGEKFYTPLSFFRSIEWFRSTVT